jgi:tetratricopeptide (TPR) repeat protein
MTAYDCILKGEWLYYHKAPPNKEALALFEKAAEIDLGSARAWARIAGWHGYSVYSHESPETQAMRTMEYAEKALELDDRDAKVHAIAASAYLHLGEYERSEKHIERALALNPNDAEVVFRKGLVDNYHGKHEEGMKWLEQAMRMDPHSNQLSLEVVFDALYMLRRYAEAIETFKRWSHPPAYMYAEAAACALLGDEEAAARFAASFLECCPPHMDAREFARRHVAICRRQEDKDHWLEGYRKAGLKV